MKTDDLTPEYDACVCALLSVVRQEWTEATEPDYESLRKSAVDEWGDVFAGDLAFFDNSLEVLGDWGLIHRIRHAYADPIEVIDPVRVRAVAPEFAVLRGFNKVLELRGREGAVQWLRAILGRIAEAQRERLSNNSQSDEAFIEDNSLEKERPDWFDDQGAWEPLPLDRSGEDYQDTVEGLEQAIRAIGADNGFTAEMPDERGNLVMHAEATLDSVKAGKVTRTQVREHFVRAGRWLGDKFGGSALAALGAELVKLGLRVLGWIA